MPLLAGYLIGSMLGGGGLSRSQPMYRTPQGGYTNAARTSTFSSNTGRAALNSSQFARPAATAGQAPMSRATAASRGGIGATGGSRSFGG